METPEIKYEVCRYFDDHFEAVIATGLSLVEAKALRDKNNEKPRAYVEYFVRKCKDLTIPTKRFYELLEKRKSLTANVFEEEELMKLATDLKITDVDPSFLTYSNSGRLSDMSVLLDKMNELL